MGKDSARFFSLYIPEWAHDQQHHYHLRAGSKRRLSGCTPHLLNHNVHFNSIPRWSECILMFEKECSKYNLFGKNFFTIYSELKNSLHVLHCNLCYHEENKQNKRDINPSGAVCSPTLILFLGGMAKSHLEISGLHKSQQVSLQWVLKN